jgi:hypothetical protein
MSPRRFSSNTVIPGFTFSIDSRSGPDERCAKTLVAESKMLQIDTDSSIRRLPSAIRRLPSEK